MTRTESISVISYEEAVDAPAMPKCLAVAEISAAIFVGASSGRFRKTGEALKCAGGQTAKFGFSGAGSRGSILFARVYKDGMRLEKGVAFRDTLAGLKNSNHHQDVGTAFAVMPSKYARLHLFFF